VSDISLTRWIASPRGDVGIHFLDRDGWATYSYADLADAALRAATWLGEQGVGRGEGVAVLADASPLSVAAFFGASLLGATVGFVYPPAPLGARRTELERAATVIAGLGAKVLVASADQAASFLQTAADASGCHLATGDLDLLRGYARTEPGPEPSADAVAFAQFTSGSTGRARSVPITHGMVRANVGAIGEWLAMADGDAVASWLPMAHDMGLVGCLLVPVAHQRPLWLMPPHQFLRRPDRYLQCFDGGKATISAVPNFALDHIVRRVSSSDVARLDLSAWRVLILGAEPLRATSIRRFEAHLAPAGLGSTTIRPAYGLAEATLAVTGQAAGQRWSAVRVHPGCLQMGMSATAEPPDDAEDVEYLQLVVCGQPLREAQMRVCGADGRQLPDGHLGQVKVAGPSVARGFLGGGNGDRDEDTDGFLATGDLGFVTKDGLVVVGRRGDAAKVRGVWVFAEAVDALLVDAGVPARAVATVLCEAAAGPLVVVFLENTQEGLTEHVRTVAAAACGGAPVRVLSVPRGSISRTTSGKVARQAMAERVDLSAELPGLATGR
jgi:acyl-CoA synthetase (AMP-forming)/AMP-acid ligase II